MLKFRIAMQLQSLFKKSLLFFSILIVMEKYNNNNSDANRLVQGIYLESCDHGVRILAKILNLKRMISFLHLGTLPISKQTSLDFLFILNKRYIYCRNIYIHVELIF